MISFEVLHKERESRARAGVLKTPRGTVQTPVFMPVGTAGTVKATPHEFLVQLETPLILANTYHLYLRPGPDVVRNLGGLHDFISWEGPILTDSGGYQVFSHRELNKISDEGVEFRSHLDGSRHFFSPETSIQVQEALGADIIMAFDDCTPYPVSHAEAHASMERSMAWAGRCRAVWEGSRQALFGIVQGSVYFDLRLESLSRILQMDFPGLALGGFSVGEPKPLMHDLLCQLSDQMPEELPHYLMGVGTPVDLVLAVQNGFDMFDCVLPTRNARNGTLFTWQGLIRIKNACYREDRRPIDQACGCFVCQKYSRAYLRHLYISGEILSSILNTFHNLYFYMELMREIRTAIERSSLGALTKQLTDAYGELGVSSPSGHHE
jgi:queuine tRNA-ribosyltransferase